MEMVVRFLNAIIKSIEILIDAFVKVLDRAIATIETVSKKILSLFLSFFRLLFYILPFILFVIIGSSKHWNLVFYIGVVVLGLVFVLFVRDFLITFKSREEEGESLKIEKAGRVIVIMIILNIITVTYSVVYYLFGISSEEYVRNVLKLALKTVGIIAR